MAVNHIHGCVWDINNRLCVQWGIINVPGTYAQVYFPITYTRACFNVQATALNTDSAILNLNAKYTNRCEIDYPASKSGKAMWVSMGY